MDLLDTFGFTGGSNNWLGTKCFKEYGRDNNTVITAILKESNKLKVELTALLSQ
jgi:hypothetical protein